MEGGPQLQTSVFGSSVPPLRFYRILFDTIATRVLFVDTGSCRSSDFC